MYKIMIYIDTHSGDKWFYYQENEKDYVAYSLHEIKDTVLTLIDTYGKDNIKIVKQITGEDMEGSVETFIYDSTDNYEELINRPSINGVEIIGALSLAELGIQPAGDYATDTRVSELEQVVSNIDFSPYATNTRVDQVEDKVDNIDLTPYATMDYLDEVVAGIDFSSSNENITGVKTFSVLPRSTVAPTSEDELTNKSYVDHGVENCASKEYVDEAIAQIPVGGKGAEDAEIFLLTMPECDYYANYNLTSTSSSMTDEIKQNILYILDSCTKKKIYYPCIKLTGTKLLVAGGGSGCIFKPTVTCTPPTSTGYYSYSFEAMGSSRGSSANPVILLELEIGANYDSTTQTWSEPESYRTMLRYRTNSDIQFATTGYLNRTYLSTYNTTSYTPTSDYHPATKKYVDDSIAAIDISTGSSNAIEQVEALPSGSEELVGKVYQYIGATNSTYGYVHGNYYVCTKKMYLNKHNDRKTSYSWVNTQLENIIKEIPMHEYRNTSGVNFLTPGEHQVWGGTTFDVASDLSKILKRYTSDYNSCLFLYSERLTTDTQEYVSVLFTVSYNTTIDNVQYQVLEGIAHSIKNPGKTAHVVLRTAINGFNDYSCSPVFIVTEQSGANLDNYYTKEEVDAAISAAITTVLGGEY